MVKSKRNAIIKQSGVSYDCTKFIKEQIDATILDTLANHATLEFPLFQPRKDSDLMMHLSDEHQWKFKIAQKAALQLKTLSDDSTLGACGCIYRERWHKEKRKYKSMIRGWSWGRGWAGLATGAVVVFAYSFLASTSIYGQIWFALMTTIWLFHVFLEYVFVSMFWPTVAFSSLVIGAYVVKLLLYVVWLSFTVLNHSVLAEDFDSIVWGSALFWCARLALFGFAILLSAFILPNLIIFLSTTTQEIKGSSHQFKTQALKEEKSECSICLVPLTTKCVPCSNGHKFHHDCIQQWTKENMSCPTCRQIMPTFEQGSFWKREFLTGHISKLKTSTAFVFLWSVIAIATVSFTLPNGGLRDIIITVAVGAIFTSAVVYAMAVSNYVPHWTHKMIN